MRRFLRSWCAPLALLGCAVALFGCGGTREDRTITFSAGGDKVGFQHGREGVFVADKEGGGLTKIFTPDKDVIAVGTPLWAPNDKRLIFTTARPLSKDAKPPTPLPSEPDPAGRVVARQPAVYTCWLRDEPQGGAAPEPRELFTAQVDDAGYVAAGLAVRWHPKGDRVLYVKQLGEEHAVFEFDLKSEGSRRVSPSAVSAKAVVFDWTPDGSRLVFLLAGTPKPHQGGIWIALDNGAWWHPSESASLGGESGSPLERLKAARPAWTKDGQRFAFASSPPGGHFLWLGALQGHRVEQLLEEKQPMHDLAWHPDGDRLGFLTGRNGGTLRVTNLKDAPVTVTPKPVRTFAGWDAKGGRLAYTTADDIPLKDEGGFSLLLFPDPLARDTLWVAPADGKGEARAVVSGLRTTFAQWSPGDGKLSQWFTFCPTHRWLMSRIANAGLRRGDPAAVIDAGTGKIAWMAVDGHEKAQVGHYHLLKRDYAEAWRWYEQADRDLAANPRPETADALFAATFRDFSFFEYYCLDKLGRKDESGAKLAAFRAAFERLLRPGGAKTEPVEVTSVCDFYAAEVFLSLDAAEDGEAFFRQALAGAKTDEDRLSAGVVLSQLLLLEGRHGDYATLVTEVVAPLIRKSWRPQPRIGPNLTEEIMTRPAGLAALGVLPLSRADLLAKVPDDRLPQLLASWEAFWSKPPDDLFALGSGLVLEALYKRTGRLKEAGEVRQRLRTILARAELPVELDGNGANREVRKTIESFGDLVQLLRGQ